MRCESPFARRSVANPIKKVAVAAGFALVLYLRNSSRRGVSSSTGSATTIWPPQRIPTNTY